MDEEQRIALEALNELLANRKHLQAQMERVDLIIGLLRQKVIKTGEVFDA